MQTATLNFKDVLQSATSKGYDSIICFFDRYGGSATLPRSVTDEAKQVGELALIQKWLREKHGIVTEAQFCPQDWKFYCKNYNTNRPFAYMMDMSTFSEGFVNGFPTFEETILQGVNEALNTLKVI